MALCRHRGMLLQSRLPHHNEQPDAVFSIGWLDVRVVFGVAWVDQLPQEVARGQRFVGSHDGSQHSLQPLKLFVPTQKLAIHLPRQGRECMLGRACKPCPSAFMREVPADPYQPWYPSPNLFPVTGTSSQSMMANIMNNQRLGPGRTHVCGRSHTHICFLHTFLFGIWHRCCLFEKDDGYVWVALHKLFRPLPGVQVCFGLLGKYSPCNVLIFFCNIVKRRNALGLE